MRKINLIFAVIMAVVLIVTCSGCDNDYSLDKNNINKYTYAEDDEPVKVVKLTDEQFDRMYKSGINVAIDDFYKKYGLGTIRQTVIKSESNFVAYSVYENSKGDRLYVFFDNQIWDDGEYNEGWQAYSIEYYYKDENSWGWDDVSFDSRNKKDELINKLDMP
ncbi:MAG: hypothetical protein IJV39_06615 [Ruminococcus sp.]|nr:hypothetical protein [Ruminococcus sp.]